MYNSWRPSPSLSLSLIPPFSLPRYLPLSPPHTPLLPFSPSLSLVSLECCAAWKPPCTRPPHAASGRGRTKGEGGSVLKIHVLLCTVSGSVDKVNKNMWLGLAAAHGTHKQNNHILPVALGINSTLEIAAYNEGLEFSYTRSLYSVLTFFPPSLG